MDLSSWIRQIHRWIAMTFTVTVIGVVIAYALTSPDAWVPYVPLFPLAFLLLTGLYLFVLPHAIKRRSRRAAASGR